MNNDKGYDGGNDANGSSEPRPPGDVEGFDGGDGVPNKEHEKDDGSEAGGIDEDGGQEGLAELLIELSVDSGLEGVSGACGEGGEEQEPSHRKPLRVRCGLIQEGGES